MADTKIYRVEYQIAANDAASAVFEKMARAAKNSVAPINSMLTGIGNFSQQVAKINENDSLKNLMALKPQFNETEWKKSLDSLITIARNKATELKGTFSKPLQDLIPKEGSSKAFNDLKKQYDDLTKSFNEFKKAASKPVTGTTTSGIASQIKTETDALKKLEQEQESLIAKREDINKRYANAKAEYAKAVGAFNSKAGKLSPQFGLVSKDPTLYSAQTKGDWEPLFQNATKAKEEFTSLLKQKKEVDEAIEKANKNLINARKEAESGGSKSSPAIAVSTGKSAAKTVDATTSVEEINKRTAALNNLLETVNKLKSQFKFTADINTAPAIAKINDLLHLVRDNAVTIPITFGGTGINPRKAIDEATGKISEEGRIAADEANSIINQGKNRSKKQVKSSEPTLIQRIQDQIAEVQKTLPTIPLKFSVSDGGSLQAKVNEIVKSIKPAPIKVDVIPVNATKSAEGLKNVPKKTKGGESLGKLTKNISEEYSRLQKYANEKPIIVRSIFNGSQAQFDLSVLIHRLQKYANELPVIARSVFNGSEAKFNLSLTLHELQRYAESHPVVISTKLTKPKTDINKLLPKKQKYDVPVNIKFKTSGISQKDISKLLPKKQKYDVPVNVKLKATGISKASIDKIIPKNKKYDIPVNVKFNSTTAAKRFNTLIKNIKGKAAIEVKLKVNTNGIAKKVRDSIKNIKTEIPLKLISKGASSSLKTVLSRLQEIANKKPIVIKTELNSGKAIEGLTTTIERLQRAVNNLNKNAALQTQNRMAKMAASEEPAVATPVQRQVNAFVSGGGSKVYGKGSNADYYTRLRAWAYPFTGNTSFGATTPAALSMMKDMGSMMAVGSFMGAIGSGLHQAIDYQNTMKTVQAILQTSDDHYNIGAFNNMQRIVRNVGKETKFTAPQVAGAARFMAMAGLNTRDISNAIRPVADVALIGDTDLATTADKLTNVMTTFGLKSSQMRTIADIMTSTFTRSNTDMMMLAESAKYAGGIAHLYGGKNFMKTFSDTMAMFGVLGNSGIQASSAGTTIRMMYQNLMQPNKNQRETLQKYGIYTRDKNGQPLQMVDILKELAAKIPRDQMADAVGKMFRITAQPGAAALATHIYDLVGNPATGKKGLIEANREAMGTDVSGHIADQKKMTLSGLMYQVQSAFGEGILQAVEGRQKQWADLLKRLTKFISSPQTIEGLSKIVDLVEYLGKTMLGFVKIWVKGYTMFPNFINSLLKAQMIFTQIGYLFTPFVQMVGTLRTLLTMIPGVKGIGGGAGVGSLLGAGALSTGGAIAYSNNGGRYTEGERAMFAMMGAQATTPTAELLAAKDKKWRYEVARDRLRNSVMYHGERTAVSPLWYAPMAQFGINKDENPAEWKKSYVDSRQWMKERSMFAATNIEARQAAARRAQESVERQQAIINAERAKMAEMQRKRFALMRSMRRPAQLANVELMARYANMAGDTALVASVMPDFKSKALRDSSFAKRLVMSGNKNFAKIGWSAAFKGSLERGFNAGSVGFINGIKRMFTSAGSLIKNFAFTLLRGLSTAIGFLVSPVGLATTALIGLTAAGAYFYNKVKKWKEQTINNANDYGKTIINNARKQKQHIDNITGRNNLPNFQGGSIDDNDSAIAGGGSRKAKLVAIKDIDWEKANKAQTQVDKIFKNNRFGFSNGLEKYRNLKPSSLHNRTDVLSTRDDASVIWYYLFGGYKDAHEKENTEAAANRERNSLIVKGANAPETIKAQNKIIELRKKYIAGQINYASFQKKVEKIINSAINTKGTLNADNYSFGEIRRSNPKRFIQYQKSALNVLKAELRGDVGTLSGYYTAQEELRKGIPAFTNKWSNAVRRLLGGMTFTLHVARNSIRVTMNTLPNGKLDFSDILAQIRQKVASFKGTITNFAYLVSNVYSFLASNGFIGKYYKDARKFAHDQLKHKSISYNEAAEYFDKYIGKGNGKATWGGMNRHQYASYISSSKGKKAARERQVIRMNTADAAVDPIVANLKRQQAQAKALASSANNAVTPKGGSGKGGKATGNGGTGGTGGGYGTGGGSGAGNGNNQKDYASTYDRGTARPTQVNITIDSLCRFDRTMIAKNADEKEMIEMIENKLGEAISMLASSALNTAGTVIQQGLN